MAIDFPSAPNPNDTFVSGSRMWVWNATAQAWEAPSINYTPVDRAGDTMTGPLTSPALRATGDTPFTSGAGVELRFDTSNQIARLEAYDHSNSAHLPLDIAAANLTFSDNGLRSASVSARVWSFDLPPTVGSTPVSLQGHTHADYVALTGGTMTGPLILSGNPSSPMEAATRQYVDSVAQGLGVRQACRAATTADIALSGLQTIDGIALAAGDRVLVKNQTNPAQNGIYIAASGAWTRSTDMDAWAEVLSAFTFIEQGTVNGKTGWASTTLTPTGTIGTDAINWQQFSAAGVYTGSGGLTLSGSDFRLADMPANTLKGRITSAGAPQDLTVAQVRTLLGLGSAAYVPTSDFAPAAHSHSNYLLLTGGTLTGHLTIKTGAGSAILTLGDATATSGWGKVEAPGTLYLNYDNYTRPIVMGRAGQSLAVTINGTLTAIGTIKQGNNDVWHAGNFNPASKVDTSALDSILGNRVTVASTSINSATSPGVYTVSYGSYSNSLLVFGYTGSTRNVQIEASYNGLLRWRAHTDGATWNDWRTIWHSANDGAGSGLDADLLDGNHASAFALAGHTHNYLPNTTVGSYASYAVTTARGGYYGLLFGTNTNAVAAMFSAAGLGGLYSQSWAGGSNLWLLYFDGTNWHIGGSSGRKVWHAANDGAGSGLDADMLDGIHADGFFRTLTNTWLTSADGQQRFHFSVNSHTYIKSPAAFCVRTGGSSTDTFTFAANGAFTASGDVTAFSDRRLKGDLQRIENALSKVRQLTGYTYTILKTGERRTGLIAQDVEAVLQEAVHVQDDGTLSLAYGNMMGLIVEAIKELHTLVVDLKRKVAQ